MTRGLVTTTMARKQRLPLCAALLATTMWMLPSTAARAEAPTAQAVRAAKLHYAEGKKFQDAGQWDAAITEYEAAYKLAPKPQLMFNIGQCQRLKGDKLKAVEAYETYIAAAPEGDPAADEAREYVTTLKLRLEVERAEAASRKAAEEAELIRKQAAEAEAARKRAEEETAARLKRIAEEEDRKRREAAAAVEAEKQRQIAADKEQQRREAEARNAGRPLRIAGVVGVCVGFAVGLLAFAIVPDADSNRSMVENARGMWTPQLDNAVRNVNTDATAIEAMWGIGGGLILVGSIVAIAGAVERSQALEKVKAQPSAWLSPTGGGVGVAGSF